MLVLRNRFVIKSPRLSEERAAWKDAQKIQAEQKRGTDEIQTRMAQIDAAREEAEIQADKELALTELVLKEQA